jgi:hypothetical protein
MKKVIVIVASFALVAAGFTPAAQANSQKTLVIIDSGIAAELPFAKEMIIEEACFIEFGRCPNGQSTMFGKGAASLPVARVNHKAMHHGTQMASVAYQIDPSTKLVMIRIVGMSEKGFANSYTTRAVTRALSWVNLNADRLNVGAVSLSIGRSYKEASCPIESELQAQVQQLSALNIPVVAATGNGSNRVKVDYPACIPEVLAIGATDRRYTVKAIQGWVYPIMLISNSGPDLDFYALGRYPTTDVYGQQAISIGTSSAAVAFATNMVRLRNTGLDYPTVLSGIKTSLVNAYRTVTDFARLHYQIGG